MRLLPALQRKMTPGQDQHAMTGNRSFALRRHLKNTIVDSRLDLASPTEGDIDSRLNSVN